MPKCYIFAIGGTGARVLESLTYLLTAGCGYDEFKDWEFVPIMIDLDAANGNVARCKTALDNYMHFQNLLSGSKVPQNQRQNLMCRYKVTKLDTLRDYMLPIDLTHKNNLAAFVRYSDLNMAVQRENGQASPLSTSQHLMDLLYSQDELNMELSVGFKGHPNIGAIVLNQVTKQRTNTTEYENRAFNDFVQGYQTGDRVFVISSIFGGMGASGFPHFMKVLDGLKERDAKFVSMKVGTLSVMPYYSVKEDKNSHIDSNSFITRTKAALQYYSRKITNMSAAYYAGAPSMQREYKNTEGGECQKNDAHALEFIASTSLFHFLSLTEEALQGDITNNGHIYRFGANDNNNWQLTFAQLDETTKNLVSAPLTYLYLLRQTLHIIDRNFQGHDKAQYKSRYFTDVTWANNIELAKINHGGMFGRKVYKMNFMNDDFYKLKKFLDDYHTWLSEMGNENNNTVLSFTPFVLQPDTGRDQLGQRGSADLRNDILRGGVKFSKDAVQSPQVVDIKQQGNQTTYITQLPTHHFDAIITMMSRTVQDAGAAKQLKDLYDNLDNNTKLANKFVELVYRALIRIHLSI
jgi:hypothetical protein